MFRFFRKSAYPAQPPARSAQLPVLSDALVRRRMLAAEVYTAVMASNDSDVLTAQFKEASQQLNNQFKIAVETCRDEQVKRALSSHERAKTPTTFDGWKDRMSVEFKALAGYSTGINVFNYYMTIAEQVLELRSTQRQSAPIPKH